jgi:hypothetical protein
MHVEITDDNRIIISGLSRNNPIPEPQTSSNPMNNWVSGYKYAIEVTYEELIAELCKIDSLKEPDAGLLAGTILLKYKSGASNE